MAEQLSAQSRDGGSRLAIGVDVGGTRIKIGLVELASGRVMASRRRRQAPTRPRGDPQVPAVSS